MSKIEIYKQKKRISNRVEEKMRCARGLDDSSNDKHSIFAEFVRCDGNWRDAVVRIHASYGYYGSSSGYSAMDEDIGRYLVKAINKNIHLIIEDAIKFAKHDAEKARMEAEEEARSVLAEVSAEN